MRFIHFTEGATDLVLGLNARRVRSVPLARGDGFSNITCLHLLPGSSLTDAATEQDCALLVVSGRVLATGDIGGHIDLSGGMGIVLRAGERYSLESSKGAILIVVEAKHLNPTPEGISTPQRIMGQRWPGEPGTVVHIKAAPSSRH
jgi:hypothetical protein